MGCVLSESLSESLSERAGCCHSCSYSAFYMIFRCSTKHHITISSWISLYICLVIGVRYEWTLLMDHPGVAQPPNAFNSLWCHWTIYDMTHQDEPCNSLTQACPETGSKGGTQCALWCFSEAIRSNQHTVCWKKLFVFQFHTHSPISVYWYWVNNGQHANTTVYYFVKFKQTLQWWYPLPSSQLTFWGCWNANVTSRLPKQNWWGPMGLWMGWEAKRDVAWFRVIFRYQFTF